MFLSGHRKGGQCNNLVPISPTLNTILTHRVHGLCHTNYMRTTLLLAALLLGACQPADLDPRLPDMAQRRVVESPNDESPDDEHLAQVPDEEPIPEEPTLDPSQFYLPKWVTYSFAHRATACDTTPQWKANVQLYIVTCLPPYAGQYPGENVMAETAHWMRAYLELQGLVEDVHFELDAGFTNKVIIYILDSTYMGIRSESFDPNGT
jgi:hypothetical protein